MVFSWNYEVLKLHEVDEVSCAIPCKISNLVCSLIYVTAALNLQQLSYFLHLIAPERSLVRVKDFANTDYETFTARWRWIIINADHKTLKSGFQVNKEINYLLRKNLGKRLAMLNLFIFCWFSLLKPCMPSPAKFQYSNCSLFVNSSSVNTD